MPGSHKYWFDGLPHIGIADARATKYWLDGLPLGETTWSLDRTLTITTGLALTPGLGAGMEVIFPLLTINTGIGLAPGFGSGMVLMYNQTLVMTGLGLTPGMGAGMRVAGPLILTAGLGLAPGFGSGMAVIPAPVTLVMGTGIGLAPGFGSGMALNFTLIMGFGIASGARLYGSTPGYGSQLGSTMAVLGGGTFQLFIGGVDRTAWLCTSGASIRKAIGQATTATFKLHSEGTTYRPLIEHDVAFFVNGTRRFGGNVKQVTEEPAGAVRTANHSKFITVECYDYSGVLERRIVTHDYRDQTSVPAIVAHAAALFLDGERVKLAYCAPSTITGDELQFSDVTFGEFLRRICDKTGLTSRVDQWGNLFLEEFSLTRAPFRVTWNNKTWLQPKAVRQGKQTRTRQGVRTSTVTLSTRVETMAGSATRDWYRLEYPISASTTPIVKVNTVAAVVVRTSERALYDHDFYYTPDETFVYRNPAKAALSGSDTLEITYTPVAADVLWYSDNDAISAYAARSGGSGRMEVVADGGDIINEDDAEDVAQTMMRRQGAATITVSAKTRQDGLEPGQLLDVDADEPFLKGALLVEEVSSNEQDQTLWWSTFKASMSEPLAITAVTNATPIRITTEFPHLLVDHQTASIYACEGCTSANVVNWRVRVIDARTIELPATAGNGAYVPYTGFLIAGVPMGVRKLASADGGTAITLETEHAHDYSVPANLSTLLGAVGTAGTFDPAAPGALPVGSVNGASGIDNANGQNRYLFATGEKSILVGPQAGVPLLTPVASISAPGGGTNATLATVIAHGLSTGNMIGFQNTGNATLDGLVTRVTVLSPTTATLENTGSITASVSQGAPLRYHQGIRIASIVGSSQVVFETVPDHGLTTGQRVVIAQSVGWPGMEGVFFVTVTGPKTGELQGIFAVGTATDGVMLPWPMGADFPVTGGTVGDNFGLERIGIASISGSTVTTDAPHGVDLPNTLLTAWGPDGSAENSTVTATGLLTLTVSPTPLFRPTIGTPGGGGVGFGVRGGPARSTVPMRDLARMLTRGAGLRARTQIDKMVFRLSASIPGYSTTPLQVGTALARKLVERDGVILSAIASPVTPAQGANIIIDLNLDGVSIFDANRLVYPPNSVTVRRYTNFHTRGLRVRANQEITLDIDQVGSTFAGCDFEIVLLIAVTGQL